MTSQAHNPPAPAKSAAAPARTSPRGRATVNHATAGESRGKRWRAADVAAIAIIVLAVFLVHGSVLQHPFSGYDDPYFATPPEMASPTASLLKQYWTASKDGLYVPVARTAWWALNWLSAGPSAPLCHAASLTVHLANALLVYALLRRLVEARVAAVGGALIFALHPLQVESVAWASELKDLLAGFFGLAFLLCYVRDRQERGRASAPARVGRWLLLALLLTAAILSKPSAVVLPLLAGGLDYCVLRSGFWPTLRRAGLFVAVAVPWIIVGHASQPGFHTDPRQRPLIALHTEAAHLRHALLPLDPLPDYGLSVTKILHAGWPSHLLALAIVSAGIAVMVWLGRERAQGRLAGGLLVLMLAPLPTLGLIPFDFQKYSSVADHYLYLGLAGAALIVADLLQRLPSAGKWAIAVALPLAAGASSFVDTARWSSDLALWSHNVNAQPEAALALANYAVVSQSPGDRASLQRAIVCLERSLQLQEDQFVAHDDLAMCYLQAGLPDRAILHMKRTIELNDEHHYTERSQAEAECALATLLIQRRRPAEAAIYFHKALQIDPANRIAREGLRRLAASTPGSRP